MKDITKQKKEWDKLRLRHPAIGDYIDFNIFSNYNENKNRELIELIRKVEEAVLLSDIFDSEASLTNREWNLKSAQTNIKKILKLLDYDMNQSQTE